MPVLSRPYFYDEKASFDHLESVLWPDAPICTHWGSVNAKHYDLGKTRFGLGSGLGYEDNERAFRALTGVVGKRLTYRQPDGKPSF